ncbi:hypothetical protein MTO96_010925 [Rhipicephalus appendiculatus]
MVRVPFLSYKGTEGDAQGAAALEEDRFDQVFSSGADADALASSFAAALRFAFITCANSGDSCEGGKETVYNALVSG